MGLARDAKLAALSNPSDDLDLRVDDRLLALRRRGVPAEEEGEEGVLLRARAKVSEAVGSDMTGRGTRDGLGGRVGSHCTTITSMSRTCASASEESSGSKAPVVWLKRLRVRYMSLTSGGSERSTCLRNLASSMVMFT